MSKIYKHYEIYEEHELEFFFREFECWQCNGNGETQEFFEGNEYKEGCDGCGGTGVVYLRDCRPCKHCGTKIYFEKQGEKYIPIDAATDESHRCQN